MERIHHRDHVEDGFVEIAKRAAILACQQSRENLRTDEGELVADERLPPGISRKQRSTEPRICLQQRSYQIEWPIYQSGVLLHRHEPGAGHPDEPRGFHPGLYPGEIRELLARPGFKDPVADLRIDPVSRVE